MKLIRTFSLKIDWANHLIAFVTTLLGIFIAFQLDDWQDRRRQREQVFITLKAIRKEIEINMEIYRQNQAALSQFTEFVDFIFSHTKDDKLVCGKNEYNFMRSKNPDRFSKIKFIKKYNDTLNVYSQHIDFDVAPQFGISTSNWEAAKSSGVLNNMDQTHVALLTQMYSWIYKDVGYKESDLFKSIVTLDEFDNLDAIVYNYKMIAKVSGFRLSQIEISYKKMNWTTE